MKLTDISISRLEKLHNVFGIDSKARQMAWFFDEERKSVVLMTGKGRVLLNKGQLKTVCEECKGIYEMVFG